MPPENYYLQALTKYWETFTVKVAADMALADHMKEGVISTADLAAKVNAHPDFLYRILRSLASAGLTQETAPKVFALTPTGELLRSDLPNSFRWMVMSEFGAERVAAWHAMDSSIKSGVIAFDHIYKFDIWEYYRQHPEKSEYFSRWMTQLSFMFGQMIAGSFDFAPYQSIIDVGGGQGILLQAILNRAPGATGTLADLPQVLDPLPEMPRIRRAPGSFFESVPAGGDLYLLKFILHDWDREKCLTILGNIRRAMSPAGKLIVIESLLTNDPEKTFPYWMDINMMIMTGGQERTAAEYAELLASGGFAVEQTLPTQGVFSLVVARPV